jgi:hypothetical protein|tara:strand:- start:115 stop:495 length:381 start_codon:yes stop_codon:yes gene_type:complete
VTCGVCIEQHDHHCPWLGTCIGYRNLKFFVSFLFWILFHSLLTLTISVTVFIVCTDQINDYDNFIEFSIITQVLIGVASFYSFCLLIFFLHQLCSLGVKNITTNEHIRYRWNGHPRNRKAKKIFLK